MEVCKKCTIHLCGFIQELRIFNIRSNFFRYMIVEASNRFCLFGIALSLVSYISICKEGELHFCFVRKELRSHEASLVRLNDANDVRLKMIRLKFSLSSPGWDNSEYSSLVADLGLINNYFTLFFLFTLFITLIDFPSLKLIFLPSLAKECPVFSLWESVKGN